MKAHEITKMIYRLYGSSSGYLFGIPPAHRVAVGEIVKLAVNMDRAEDEAISDDADREMIGDDADYLGDIGAK